jgi:predicted ester cyclase
LGIPATRKGLEWTSIAIFQLSGGKIKVRWEIADIFGIMQQLSMEPKPKEREK